MVVKLTALVTALLLDVLLGDPPNRFHPVVAMGSLIRKLTADWNRGGSGFRLVMGIVVVLLGGALFSLPWLLVEAWVTPLADWLQGVLLGILLKPVFSCRSLLKAGREVQMALQDGDLEEGRRLVSWHLVSRDTSQLSEGEVASAAVESLAENLTDSFLAPLMYFTIGGLPLAWAYRFVNTADAMIGYRTKEFETFGKAAARFDDALNWLPARISALAIVFAAILPGYSVSGAWRTMRQQFARTVSPNAGWTMAAAAGALGVRLEKRGAYCLEGGEDLPDIQDIRRARILLTVAMILCILFCGAAAFAVQSLSSPVGHGMVIGSV